MTTVDISFNAFSRRVLYEDNHLLAVDKPAGLLAQSDHTRRPNLLDAAKEYVRQKYDKPGRVFLGLIHRLDRQVSGVMVLARTSKAAGRLSAQFRGRGPEKVYWALVEDRPEPSSGRLVTCLAWIGDHAEPVVEGDPEGAEARLSWRVLGGSDEAALLEVHLETGRRHQIRAQLAAMGHPLFGDRLYGSRHAPEEDAIGLMARQLTIDHPTLKTPLVFTAPVPGHWPWTLARQARLVPR